MMKMNFKMLGFLIVIALAFTCGNAALATHAVDSNAGNARTGEKARNKGTDKKLEIKKQIQSKFCENFDGLINGLQNKIAEQKNNILEKREERLAGLEENAAERDTKISDRRSLRDRNMNQHFQGLAEKAQTEAQKNAAKKFQQIVRSAIETRRNAMDAAIESFREGVAKIHAERKNYLDAETDKYTDAQKQALEKAKNACQNNGDETSIRNSLKNSLKLAKNNFSAEKKNAEKIQTQMKALIQIRKKAIEKADADFKATVNEARTELKKAFANEVFDN